MIVEPAEFWGKVSQLINTITIVLEYERAIFMCLLIVLYVIENAMVVLLVLVMAFCTVLSH